MKLTENFYLSDFIVSSEYPELASKIEISDYDIDCFKLLCESILQPIWNRFGAVNILSGKRSRALNKAVKGASDSDHLHSIAADIVIDNKEVPIDMFNVFKWVVTSPHPLPYRQVIYYPESNSKFVHVSINKPGRVYKREAFIKDKRGYQEWSI